VEPVDPPLELAVEGLLLFGFFVELALGLLTHRSHVLWGATWRAPGWPTVYITMTLFAPSANRAMLVLATLLLLLGAAAVGSRYRRGHPAR
jgi:hypothetical protein